MSQNKPENSQNIQITPVQFSPPSNQDAIGNVGGFLPTRQSEYPVFIPLIIIVVTLIFSTVRDISTFNHSVADIQRTEAPALEVLKQANKQTEYVDGLRVALQKLGTTDPVTAQIYKDFFPEKKPAPDAGASASGQGPAPAQNSAPAK